jgi:hypothetical protein
MKRVVKRGESESCPDSVKENKEHLERFLLNYT